MIDRPPDGPPGPSVRDTRLAGRLGNRLGSTLGARVLMAAINFGQFWALSHSFDMASLGTYSLLMNLFFMTLGLPLMGLSLSLNRRSAASPHTVAAELCHVLLIALPLGAVLMLAIGLYGQRHVQTETVVAFWLLGAAVWVSAWIVAAEAALVGLEQMSYVARAECAESLIRTGATLAVVAFGGGLAGVMAVFLALRLGLALVYIGSGRLPRLSTVKFDRALLRRNIGELPVFFGIATLAAVVSRMDLLFLDQLAGTSQVALYAVSARLYDATLMLPTAVALVLLPALARLFAGDERRFSAGLCLMLQGVIWIGLATTLVIAALAQPLIDLLYPAHYAAAADILRWLMLAALLTAIDQVLSSAMIASGSQQADLRSLVLSILVLAPGLYLSIPIFGPLGVAYVVVAALAVRVGWRLAWAWRRFSPPGLSALLLQGATAGVAGGIGLVTGLAHGPWLALAGALAGLLAGALLTGQLGLRPWRHWARWRERLAASGIG